MSLATRSPKMGDFQLEVATAEEIHEKPSEEEASNGSWMSHESRGSSMRGIFGRPMGNKNKTRNSYLRVMNQPY